MGKLSTPSSTGNDESTNGISAMRSTANIVKLVTMIFPCNKWIDIIRCRFTHRSHSVHLSHELSWFTCIHEQTIDK